MRSGVTQVAWRKLMMSPSSTMYSLPSRRTSPCSRHAAIDPRAMSASYATTSARMLDVRMDFAGRLLGGRRARNRPGAAFILADGEKRDVAEQVVAGSDDAIEPRLGETEVREERVGVGCFELRDLQLDLGAERDRACRRVREKCRQAGLFRGASDVVAHVGDVVLIEIDHQEQWLGGKELEAA